MMINQKNIRLGLDIRILAQPMGGVARYVIEILKYFKKQNDYLVIGFTDSPILEEYEAVLQDVQVYKLPFGISKKDWRKKVLINQLSEAKIDIYHCTYDKGIPYKKVCSYIKTIHDVFPHTKHNVDRKKMIKQLKLWCRNYREARDVDHILTVSNSSKKDIVKTFNLSENKVTHVYLDCSKEIMDHALKQVSFDDVNNYGLTKQKYFISIPGKLHDVRKNLAYLLQAYETYFKRLRSEAMSLIVVGRWDKKNPLMKEVKDKGLESHIIFTDYLEDSKMYVLLKNARSKIFTSLYEGFGIPSLEALYFGVPLITSNNSAMAELGANGVARLVDPYKPEELATALEEFTYEDLKNYQTKGRERAKDFDWEESMKKIHRTYQLVMQIKGA